MSWQPLNEAQWAVATPAQRETARRLKREDKPGNNSQAWSEALKRLRAAVSDRLDKRQYVAKYGGRDYLSRYGKGKRRAKR